MTASPRIFKIEQTLKPRWGWIEWVVFLGLAGLIYLGVRLSIGAPAVIPGGQLNLAPGMLPYYALLSLGRMLLAYGLSLSFALSYGTLAASSRRAEQVLLPVLDVLQSIPILSFLPVVFLSFSALLPEHLAMELAAIVLIFTSQAWNLVFSWYQSLTTIPKELREASVVFQFSPWLRLKTLELPFGAIGLIWNSMMSWAGGWFFLMAAEIFTAGARDFHLPGLGAYLQEAANRGDLSAIGWGVGTLILMIVILDQLMWRPLLTWSDRFKLELVEGKVPPRSWFYQIWRHSRLMRVVRSWAAPWGRRLDDGLIRRFPGVRDREEGRERRPWVLYGVGAAVAGGLGFAAFKGGLMLVAVTPGEWGEVIWGLMATWVRVATALILAVAWTVPVGVAIGTNPGLAAWLQPLVQITASIPATALFPVITLVALSLPGGLNLAAIVLMLLGTQWYLLFNVIAGASAIPQDLKDTAALLQLNRWQRWRTLMLPALFPYIITGAITASGGAWNASIVAEYSEFGGKVFTTTGIGALIATATATNNYPLLLAATLAMVAMVSAINRLVWRRLYRLAEERFRME